MNWVIGLVSVILGSGTVAAFLEYRSRDKKRPIDNATAVVAMSEKAGTLALAIATRQDKDIEALRSEVAKLAAELARKSDLLDRVIRVIHGFHEWYDGKIVNQWDVIRTQPVAPPLPVEYSRWDANYSALLDD